MTVSTRVGVVVFAHGSRDPQWREPVEAVAHRIAHSRPDVRVVCAYLESCAPDLQSAVADLEQQGVCAVRVLPVFLGLGKHLREDLPQLRQSLRNTFPAITFEWLPAVGEDERLTRLLANMALEHLP